MNNLSDIGIKPNMDVFLNDTSKIVSDIMDLFTKQTGSGGFTAPGMDPNTAFNYMSQIKMPPGFSALYANQIEFARITFGKMPFGLTGGELSINGGLFNGLSFGFTPATTATTQAAATAATEATATVAATTATTAAVEAGAGAAAVGTATATTGAAAGATAGSAVPVVGTAIGAAVGAVLGFLASLLPKAKEEFDKHSGDFAAVMIGGGMFGLMMGNPFLAVGGLAIGIPTAFLSGVGPRSLLSRFANGFSALFTGAVLPQITTPLIAFLVGFPVFVAFVFFVINSGAYVVPPQINPVTGGISQGLVASGTCPLVGGGRITTSSYNPDTELGHGSNVYWQNIPGTDCYFDIPIPGSYPGGCRAPTREENPQGTNVCLKNGTQPACPYYGFATDFVPVQGPNPGGQVALPVICEAGQTDCTPLTWKYVNGFWNCSSTSNPLNEPPGCANPNGKGTIWDAESNGKTYRLYLNHIDNIAAEIGQSYPSGTIIGETANIVGPHLHVELVIDGVPVRPDFLCNGSAGTGVGGSGSPIKVGLKGYYIESTLSPSNVVVSSPYEYGKTTCDWAGIKNLTSSINANFFDAATAPIGPAGYNGLFTNYLSSAQAQKYTLQSLVIGGGGGQITSSYGLTDLKLQALDAVVTGITYNSAIEEVRPRTAIGINGNKLLMMVTEAATPSKVKEVMDELGATQSFLLDGGSSTTYCEGGALKYTGKQDGKPAVVSVSIGVKSGIVHELTP